MKTITCAQFGGPCDHPMTAATEKDMKAMAWKHVAEVHPEKMEETKEAMENATPEQKAQTDSYFHKVWEGVQVDAA